MAYTPPANALWSAHSGEDPKHVDPEFASPLKNGREKKQKYQSISGTPA